MHVVGLACPPTCEDCVLAPPLPEVHSAPPAPVHARSAAPLGVCARLSLTHTYVRAMQSKARSRERAAGAQPVEVVGKALGVLFPGTVSGTLCRVLSHGGVLSGPAIEPAALRRAHIQGCR
ncbi:hypothetical protein MRX96_037414 [Rhipicephalus microplus]